MTELRIVGFETSNNMKVRVALGFKGIPYHFESIDPRDREGVLERSGQPLTPVLTHGDVVLFDSSAILRYLEANFPGTPKLFATDQPTTWAIEDWESFGRTRLSGPLMAVVRRRLTGRTDEAATHQASADFTAAVAEVEAALEDREWLVDNRLTAAEVTTAPVVHRVMSTGMLTMPADLERTRGWVARVMAFDGRLQADD